MTNDLEGSRSDKQTAERKIAEYRSKLNDSTFSIYADTSRRFNQLLSFESEFAGNRYESLNAKTGNIALLPMFKFSLMTADTLPRPNLPGQYYVEQSEQFLRDVGDRGLRWVNRDSDLPADTLFLIDARFRRPAARRRRLVAGLFPARRLAVADPSVHELHRELYGGDRPQSVEPVPVYQPQYDAERDDRFHFVDRQRLPADRRRQRSEQPAEDSLRSRIRLRRSDRRPEQGGQAAARLCLYLLQPGQFALSFGPDAEAIEDYTRAIELNPSFGEAYYNRGLIQIYLKDTRKGCLDMSKAGRAGRGRRVQGAEDLRPAAGPDPIGTKQRRAQCASARSAAVRPTTNY